MNVEQVSALVDEILAEKKIDDCFLVEALINLNKIEVYLDSDSQVDFSICRQVSRGLEEVFDREGWFGEKYTLEVSSAGVGRPLKFQRQYVKNVGRKIEVKSAEGSKYTGVLQEATEDEIKVVWSEREKVGKKKVTVEKSVVLSYDQITKAKIKVSF